MAIGPVERASAIHVPASRPSRKEQYLSTTLPSSFCTVHSVDPLNQRPTVRADLRARRNQFADRTVPKRWRLGNASLQALRAGGNSSLS